MNIALIGPSGVGKGTHADKLMTKFNLLHVVTGDLFRKNLQEQTALGLLAKRYMNRGELVPDAVVDAMIEEWLLKTTSDKGILFDGFPRTRYQAQFLDDLFNETGRKLEAVIYLKVSEQEIVNRLSGRLICHDCHTPYHLEFNQPAKEGVCDVCGGELYRRSDDNADMMVRARLRAFHRATRALVHYYQKSDRFIILDGEDEIDQVSEAIIEAIEAIRRHESRSATAEETKQIGAFKEIVRALTPEQATHASLDVVLLGGPGSGKGTQAEQLKTHLHLPHVATGDLFRNNLKNETELGRLAKTYMDRGELVPDNVTEAMLNERISQSDTSGGFILDGFPRTLAQAHALTEMMTDLQRRIDSVLYIKVSDEEIVRRLSGRLICRNCQTPYHQEFKPPIQEGICDLCGGELYQRDDDNPDTVRTRLKTYHAQTAPLIDYYQDAGLLTEIDGEGDVSEVIQRTLAAAQNLVRV
jgi:adenylate kinase